MAGSGNANAIDIDDLRRRRDDFDASLTSCRYAADEMCRAGLALFDALIAFIKDQQQQLQVLLQPGTAKEAKGPNKISQLKKRDPAMPKRPMGVAYFLFCSLVRDTVKVELGPNATHDGIKAELAKRWSDTAEDQKKEWENIAAKIRAAHEKYMATYKATKALQSAESSVGFTPVDDELQNVQESEAESDKVELTAGNEEDEEVQGSEEVEDSEEDLRSWTPPSSHKRAKTQSKKAVGTNGNRNLKDALNLIAISGTSAAATPAVVNLRAVAESAMRKRTGCKRVLKVEEEEAPDEASPENKATHKRRKHSP